MIFKYKLSESYVFIYLLTLLSFIGLAVCITDVIQHMPN